MSIDFLNQNFQLDAFHFDDYFNALITPVPENKKIELPPIKQEKHLLKENTEIKPDQFAMIKPSTIPSNLNGNKKRVIEVPKESNEIQEQEKDSKQPNKKTKKSTKNAKKKKEAPKRKRVNYCFEIHRSGCPLNKDSKLYCKVFLKGKLQSEVDLIKGARGKWAYTFYDQRKKKKERRYWPSQSSGPVIEDPCNCEKCIPNSAHEEEVDFSSPSTEEVTLIEYDNQAMNQNNMNPNEYTMTQMYNVDPSQINAIYYQNQNKIQNMPIQQNEMQDLNQYMYKNTNEYQTKNMINLKSSNDFQEKGHFMLKSSNDFMGHQRPWGEYFQNNIEYTDRKSVV